jgi:type IV pilus assembly protein PilE
MRPVRVSSGFSLVELLVVMTISAILAGIAYPSYQSQLRSARRVHAQADLMQLAQAMERVYSESGCYDNGDGGACGDGVPPPFLPAVSPMDGSRPIWYDIFVSADGLTRDTFTLVATPVAGTDQAGDGIVTLNSQGVRAWDENNDGDVGDAGEDNWERN